MKRVVVIEDNADNRLLIEALLEDRYLLTQYDTGPGGLEGIRAERPDVLLLDISLPGMDGPEVLKEIRADAALRDLPVIALTAHAMSGDRERFLALGFDEYLSKPIMDDQLLFDMIDRFAERP